MSKKAKKKKPINIDIYKRLINENDVIVDCLEITKKKFNFPVKSLLEIGTGTGHFLTRFLIESERAKKIDKFYGMEPVDELFEESKKYVVRLSRTDATAQEYFGGNPFDIITFILSFNHITDDKKRSFIKHIYNNLQDGGKLVLFDTFIPEYKTQEEKTNSIKAFINENIKYFKSKKNDFVMNYFYTVLNNETDDYIFGDYKSSLNNFTAILENIGFINIKVKAFKGEGEVNWKKMGYYVITADKEE